MNRVTPYVLVAFVAALIGLVVFDRPVDPPAPCPPPAPAPCPDGKCPPAPPSPWGPRRPAGLVGSFSARVGGPSLDGTEVSVDYPGERHRRNTSSKGLGLCVFTSIHHACDWQDVPSLLEMPRWMIERGIPGGGYPSKVAQLVPRLAQERGAAVPDFLQIESNDLEILRLACQTGRMPCVTYSHSPTGRYGGRRISHMVNLVHLDDKHAVILDNNYPGENAYEWMSAKEFLASYSGGSTGWAVIFLDVPPPMPPHNGEEPAPRESRRASETPREKDCPCSAECTCGCNQGRECSCGNPRSLPPDGVEWDKIHQSPRYHHGQYEVPREDAIAAISAGLPDDSRKLRLTVIGSKEDRERVLADFRSNRELSGQLDAYSLKAYDPSHWHVARYGFVTSGKPTIYVQDRTGLVLHRQDSYAGPEELVATLRRLRPDYRPDRDPSGPLSGLLGRGGALPYKGLLVAAAIALGLYLLTRKR